MDEQIDFKIDEQDLADVNDFTEAELADDTIDWKERAKQMTGIAKRKTTALKKAKDAFGKKTVVTESQIPDNQPKKGEIGYAEKAYLNSLGFKDAEDHTFVQNAMKETGKSLEDILKSPFVTGELKRMGEERATKAAIPPADGRGNSGPARDSVEYWINKGELPPADQPELRQKVVNAKIAKQRSGSKFSPNPVVGNA